MLFRFSMNDTALNNWAIYDTVHYLWDSSQADYITRFPCAIDAHITFDQISSHDQRYTPGRIKIRIPSAFYPIFKLGVSLYMAMNSSAQDAIC